MRARAKIVTVILCILGMAAYGWWSAYSQTILAQLETTLAAELTQALDTRVELGQLQTAGLTGAAVNNVIIFDQQGRELAVIKQVRVDYNLLSLARGQTVTAALRQITLIEPVVTLVEEADGVWNAEFLSQEKQPDSPALTVNVVIDQGIANVSAQQGQWQIAGIAGRLTIQDSRDFEVELAANHNKSQLTVAGTVNTDVNKLALTVKADQLDPTEYQTLLPANSGITFTGGLLRQVEATIATGSDGVSYAGEVLLDNVAGQVAGITIEQATGQVSFTNNYIYILGNNVLVAGQPATLRGKVGIAGDQPVLDLNVVSPGFDLAAVGHNLPVAGSAAFTASVTGIAANPTVVADVTAKKLTVSDYVLADTSAKIKLADNIVTVDELATQAAGGQVSGQGILDIGSQQYQVKLAAGNIDAAAVKGLPVTLSGRGDIYLAATGQGSDWKTIKGSTTISLADGQLEGVAYTKMTGVFEHHGRDIVIKHCDMLLPTGIVLAEGTIQDNNLAIQVDGQGIELAGLPLARLNNVVNLDGRVDFEGRLTGTTSLPQLGLQVNATELSVNQQFLGQASGTMTASPAMLTFEQVELTDGAARHLLSGNVVLTGAQPELNLKLASRSARAETFARMIMPKLPLTGNVEQIMLIDGPLNNIAVRGKLRLTQGSFGGYLIDKAEGSYRRQGGVITLENLTVDSPYSQITLAGTVAADDSLNFAVTAQNIDIARLKIDYPYPVAGLFNLNGQITGSIASPAASGLLTSSKVTLNNQDLTDIYADLSYQAGQADVREFRFAQGEGSYVFNGAIDFETHGIDGILRAQGGELFGIMIMADVRSRSLRGLRGQLSGEIVLSGSIDNPNLILRGAIANAKIKNYLFDSVDIDAQLQNEVITVNKLMARQGPNGILAAKGQADLNGAINFEIGGRSIDTGLIAALFDTTVETTGKFSFTAQASGATADPNVSVSLEVQDGSVANGEFDNLYGLLMYSKGSIHVNQLYVARGPYKASAYGIVPLKAINPQGRSEAGSADTMDLKLRLDNADLRILPALTKDIAWASGPTTGEIDVGGTLAAPTLDGHLMVTGGAIKFKDLHDPIQNVEIDIRLKGDKISINTFNGEMGGGNYSLYGSARVNGLALDDYDIKLVLNNLGVKHKYFTGPINGALSVASKNARPYIAGSVTVNNATVNIPAVPDSGEVAFNAGLDIEVVVGEKVRLYNPYLYDFLAEGKVKFSGTLRRPNAAGRIEARRGTVKYLTTRFTILSGSAEFHQYRSIEPVIKLQAQAKFDSTRINLNINGPATEMELKLTSEPAMSQQAIMSLLTLRGSYFSKKDSSDYGSEFGRDELISLLDAGLQMRFIAALEGTLQSALGVDEFRLVRASQYSSRRKASRQSQSEYQGYNIEVGKYLTDKLLINYSIGLDNHDNSVGFRYDLTRNIGVGGSFGGSAKTLLTLETKFAF